MQKASGWGASDPELSAYLAGYLVVLISGVYEDCIEYLINRRADKSGDPELTSYVRARTGQRFRNPNEGNVTGVLNEFSTAYGKMFERNVPTQSKVALNSIANNRTWLAHGATSKMQVTVADVAGYFNQSVCIFEVLEDIFA